MVHQNETRLWRVFCFGSPIRDSSLKTTHRVVFFTLGLMVHAERKAHLSVSPCCFGAPSLKGGFELRIKMPALISQKLLSYEISHRDISLNALVLWCTRKALRKKCFFQRNLPLRVKWNSEWNAPMVREIYASWMLKGKFHFISGFHNLRQQIILHWENARHDIKKASPNCLAGEAFLSKMTVEKYFHRCYNK